MPLVIVPEDAGLLSARGLLVADIQSEFSVTRLSRVAETAIEDVEIAFRQLEERALNELRSEGIDVANCRFERRLDMRYAGQAYEISIAQPAVADASDTGLIGAWDTEFHRLHKQLYWWNDPARPTEIVNLRVYATVPVDKVPPARLDAGGEDPSAARKASRPIVFAGGSEPIETSIYDRRMLRAGNLVVGPAVIESFDTTILVNPDYRAEVDQYSNILIRASKD
jgi:N-methylhydantoinase A/oxoprolinase/acetone carboxylase beta subunit